MTSEKNPSTAQTLQTPTYIGQGQEWRERNSKEELSADEDIDIGREELHDDGGTDGDARGEHGPFVTQSVDEGAGEIQTDNQSDFGDLFEDGLLTGTSSCLSRRASRRPRTSEKPSLMYSPDVVLAAWEQISILLGKLGEAKQTPHERIVV